MLVPLCVLAALSLCWSPPTLGAQPLAADLVQDGQLITFEQDKFRQLFAELKKEHHFTAEELQSIFQGLTINRQALVLMDKQWEAKPYYEYAALFLTKEMIAEGKNKLITHRALLDRIEGEFGVDRETVVAIWGVETRYGTRQGKHDVLQTLTTLFDAYPRRESFFRKQLVHFLLLCRENGVAPHGMLGSYAGAFGQTQFIPSSFREYAVSYDGDAVRDVWSSVPDILASIANYLKRFRWTLDAPVYAELGNELRDRTLVEAETRGRKERVTVDLVTKRQQVELPPSPGNRPVSIVGLELPPGGTHAKRFVAGYPNFHAITEWNHSNRYAMVITELAEAFNH